MTTFHLTVVTPDGCAFDGQAERIVPFIRDNTFSFYTIVFKHIHRSFFKITVNHAFLFVC